MTNIQAFMIGTALVAGCAILTNGIPHARADVAGPYQLMHHSNTVANAGVFRLDTSTGGVSYCYINASQIPTCTQEIK